MADESNCDLTRHVFNDEDPLAHLVTNYPKGICPFKHRLVNSKFLCNFITPRELYTFLLLLVSNRKGNYSLIDKCLVD